MALTGNELIAPAQKLVQSIKDIPSGHLWLEYYNENKACLEMQQKVGREVFDKGSIYLVDVKDREKALRIEIIRDFEVPERTASSKSDISFHLQILRTKETKFVGGIKVPNTEFILYDPKRNTFVPIASGNIYTRPNNEGVGEETPVIGIIGSTFSTREHEKSEHEGVLLWFHPSFYITEAELQRRQTSSDIGEIDEVTETEFPVSKLLTSEEAGQVLKSGWQTISNDQKPVSLPDVTKLLETPQQIKFLGRGAISVVYSLLNIPGWVVKVTQVGQDSLKSIQEEQLLSQIAAREKETNRPRTCPNVLSGYASGDRVLKLVNVNETESTKNRVVIMEQIEEDGKRYKKLEFYGNSAITDEKGVMQTAIRQLLLHGLTLVEVGKYEADRTELDYYWDRQENHIIVIDYNVMRESPDVTLRNNAQVRKSGGMIGALAGGKTLISIRAIKKEVEAALQTLEKKISVIDSVMDEPTLEFAIRCFYNNVIPGYQTMEEAIRVYDSILSANAILNDNRDEEIRTALNRGDTGFAYNVAYYSTDENRQKRLDRVLAAVGGKSPYLQAKEILFREDRSWTVDFVELNNGVLSQDLLSKFRLGKWDDVISDTEFDRFRGTALEFVINLMRINSDNQHDHLAEHFLMEDKEKNDRFKAIALKGLQEMTLNREDLDLIKQVKEKLIEDEKKYGGDPVLQKKLAQIDKLLGLHEFH